MCDTDRPLPAAPHGGRRSGSGSSGIGRHADSHVIYGGRALGHRARASRTLLQPRTTARWEASPGALGATTNGVSSGYAASLSGSAFSGCARDYVAPATPSPREVRGVGLYHIVPEMAPAPRTLAKGIDQAKPPSGMLALYGWRRVMRDCGRHVTDMHAASRMLRGMVEQLKARCGQDAMSVDHHIPYPLQSIVRAVAYLDNALKPGVDTGVPRLSCGRRALLTRSRPTDGRVVRDVRRRLLLSAGELHVVPGGRRLSAALQPLDAARAASPRGCSSARPTSRQRRTEAAPKWIGKHMWYRPSGSDPLNFASAWARFESTLPMHRRRQALVGSLLPIRRARCFQTDAGAGGASQCVGRDRKRSFRGHAHMA